MVEVHRPAQKSPWWCRSVSPDISLQPNEHTCGKFWSGTPPTQVPLAVQLTHLQVRSVFEKELFCHPVQFQDTPFHLWVEVNFVSMQLINPPGLQTWSALDVHNHLACISGDMYLICASWKHRHQQKSSLISISKTLSPTDSLKSPQCSSRGGEA